MSDLVGISNCFSRKAAQCFVVDPRKRFTIAIMNDMFVPIGQILLLQGFGKK